MNPETTYESLNKTETSVSLSNNCTKLVLYNNEIRSFENIKFEDVKLEILSVIKNKIMNLPSYLYNMQSLRFVNLSHNSISKIPSGISNLENLVTLDLSYNLIENVPEEIANLKKLKFLSFQNNKIQHLPKALSKMYWLTILNLQNNPISYDDFENCAGTRSILTSFQARHIVFEEKIPSVKTLKNDFFYKLKKHLVLIIFIILCVTVILVCINEALKKQ